MARPFPVHPRGPRRKRAKLETFLFACPRIAPDWELAALRALMKPQTRNAIEHRKPEQPWPKGAEALLKSTCRVVRDRLGYGPRLHFPAAGDYHFVAEIDQRELDAAKGFAAVVSARMPEAWFVFGRLFLRGGAFFRRQFGVKLKLVPATNVHLTRAVRAAVRDLFPAAR